MENQSPTPRKSNDTTQSYNETKDKFIRTVKDNLNYIYIVLMIIANCLISLLKIEDGYIGLRYPTSGLGWVMWFTQIAIATFIGVMILNAFRRQGIKNGHKSIKAVYDAYIKAITVPNKNTPNPRSLKQYLKVQSTRDSLVKALIYVVLSVFVGSVAISANLNNLLSLVVNIVFAIGFGIKAMLDAEEYVITELVVWYQIKTKEAQEGVEKNEQEGDNGKSQKGNEKPGLRPTKSSRVQQAEELTAGRTACNNEQPTQTTN